MAFGQELQLERERQHLSLDTIAAVTKIPQRHLLALEQDQFEQLPGGIFAKGIVRSYCRQLGLNEEEWLARFPGNHDADGTQALDPGWTEFAVNVGRSRSSVGASMRMRWWGVMLMAAALCGLTWVARLYVMHVAAADSVHEPAVTSALDEAQPSR